jgi:nitrate reductase gamma subunit
MADEILLLAALGFLAVCYLIFFAIRRLGATPERRMMMAIDLIFLGSMTAMVLAGFVVVYELF